MGENGMSDNMFSTTPQAMEGGIDNLIGAATAYADAVAAGYTGTREQWAEDMAKLGENLAEVRLNRKAAEDAAQDAKDARDTAVNARDTAVSTINTTRDAAVATVDTTRDKAVQTINTTRDAAVQTVNKAAETAEDAAVESIKQAAAEKVDEINGIGAVRFDGHQPLTEDEQATARSNIGAGGAIVETAQGDGTVTVEDSAHAALHGLRLFGKSTQDGTPSPDAPVPIVSVGDDGEITVKTSRKNLFDPSRLLEASGWTEENGEYNGNNVELHNAFNPNMGGYMKIMTEGRPITLSLNFRTNTSDGTERATMFIFAYDDGTSVTHRVNSNAEPKRYSFTSKKDQKSITLGFSYGNGVRVYLSDIQLEFGDTETAYEPYTGQTLPVSTLNGLPGIPVDSGGNYTDADGQQWICDEVDFGRGVYVKRIAASKIVGGEWSAASNRIFSTSFFGPNLTVTPSNMGEKAKMICSHYPIATHAKIVTSGILACSLYTNTVTFGFGDGEKYTVDTWKGFLANQDNAGTPVIIQRALVTPIETPLTAEELAAYHALRTQYPTTNVINDEGAGMEVSYVADTKTYIDNKFAELSAAILNA